jgi:hypothetical protein
LGDIESLGGWPAIGFSINDEPVLVYGNGEQGNIWLARRQQGCWGKKTVLVAGTYVHPAVLTISDNKALLGAMQLGFDSAQEPSHQIQLLEATLPQCP